MGEATNERGMQQLARDWHMKRKELERVRKAVNSAEVALKNAANALGKSIDPGDQKEGETLSVWVLRLDGQDERLVESLKDGFGDYLICLRGEERPRRPERILEPAG